MLVALTTRETWGLTGWFFDGIHLFHLTLLQDYRCDLEENTANAC